MLYMILLLLVILALLRLRRKSGTVGFFHPYCNAGGGGERVLWCAIRTMQKKWPDYHYVVFSGDRDASKEEILMKARQRFGIELEPNNIDFVKLRLRRLVEADLYPRFTMICQTLAGGILALEALWKFNPEIMIDSMGYPLSLPTFKLLGGSRVAAYVHYPTISVDMIDLVERREATYNNKDIIAQSNILSILKLNYYRAFAFIYRLAGKCADAVMVNGSWTLNHISSIWRRSDASVVFPPCDVSTFLAIQQTAEDSLESSKIVKLISIGQIRPEKDHKLQLQVLHDITKWLQEKKPDTSAQLTIAGGCRNAEDKQRVQQLQDYASELGIADNVKWSLNVPYEELLAEFSDSLISIHTMWNEHFGISVVEGMAAGAIMLAHDSGGPQMDIVLPEKGSKQSVGYLAANREEYVHAIRNILGHTRQERDRIRAAARKAVGRFSEEQFDKKWIEAIRKVIDRTA
ncbi:hypothetical protein WR25_20237 [Diploscapter pachys]|uniref:GDP-Man:Man(3)GlcNAc(2)-PP-Dol alpha-1,2-mannosyltransferase n=1 Tax=Diploscapter pachys TaxID=2018661 RepID=A0A2A2KLG1_9BILA|nr:hypothetical protein WR25_20237 [Diploscapter pachys]